jgi:hypothetical protein
MRIDIYSTDSLPYIEDHYINQSKYWLLIPIIHVNLYRRYAFINIPYSSIPNYRVPQIVTYSLFIPVYASISDSCPCIDFHRDSSRYYTRCRRV